MDAPGPELTRRGFLRGTALAVGATVGAPLAGCRDDADRGGAVAPGSEGAAAGGSGPFPHRPLGKTGLDVPILQLGGTQRFTMRLVGRALELGVNFIDTAANYVHGQSERSLGSVLRRVGDRERLIIASKGPSRSPQRLAKGLAGSLDRLGTDYVDIYYAHDLSDPAALSDEAWGRMVREMKRRGQIRHFGFSTHNDKTVALLHAAAKSDFVDVVLLKYNFHSFGDAALNEALDAAHRAGIGLIAMKTQGAAVSFAERIDPFQRAGCTKHQAVLRAVWQDERIASIDSLMSSLRMLEQNAAAARGGLTPGEARRLRTLDALTRPLYCAGGCGGCRLECERAIAGRPAIADTLRCLMYHDSYGEPAQGRHLYARIPRRGRLDASVDLSAAERACPHGLPLRRLAARAARVLA